MVRNSIDILRSSATNRRGPMRPVWNGDETEWALDSCLSGHYRYVSFPALTVLRPKPRPATARSCRPSRSSPRRRRPPDRPAAEAAPHGPPGTCAGFWFIRPRRRRRPVREWMSTRCRQRSMRSAPGRSRAPARSTSRTHCSNRCRVSSSAIRPAIRSCRTSSFAVSSHRRSPVRRRDWRFTRTAMRINEAFGDTVNWDLIPTAAIRSVTVVTNNPAFGLNALGGAVNVQMKDGFNYQGRRNQHDGRLVRAHPELGAVWQADRQFFGLWRARRRA